MGMVRKLFCPHCNYTWIYKLEIEENLYDKETLDISCYHCSKTFIIKRNYIKVYLSRSLHAADLKYKYPVDVCNKYEGIISLVDPKDIGDIDERLKHILDCDIVVVCMQSLLSTDPFFELMYASTMEKPCYVIDPGRQFSTDKWVHACANKFFENTYECFDTILPMVSVKDKELLTK